MGKEKTQEGINVRWGRGTEAYHPDPRLEHVQGKHPEAMGVARGCMFVHQRIDVSRWTMRCFSRNHMAWTTPWANPTE